MGRNRIPFVVAGVLIVLLGGGVILFKGNKKKSGPTVPQETARALSVPTNQARTVIVSPCNTPVQQTTSAVKNVEWTPAGTPLPPPRPRYPPAALPATCSCPTACPRPV